MGRFLRTFSYRIGPESGGRTVEAYLMREQRYSRKLMIKLKQDPFGLRVNGARARSVDLLRPGDLLETGLSDESRPSAAEPYEREVPVLYEDDDLIVYDKPAGLACHPSGIHRADTLAGVFAADCIRRGLAPSPLRLASRLDRDTTGALVAAKHQLAAGRLWKTVQKRYLAVAAGRLEPAEGRICLPIIREAPRSMRRVVDPAGQEAVTEYRTLAAGDGMSLLGIVLPTGRTHQIRVHLSYLGHPLCGDTFYGGESAKIGRQALHCAAVIFPHPADGREMRVPSPVPADMARLFERIEGAEKAAGGFCANYEEGGDRGIPESEKI